MQGTTSLGSEELLLEAGRLGGWVIQDGWGWYNVQSAEAWFSGVVGSVR